MQGNKIWFKNVTSTPVTCFNLLPVERDVDEALRVCEKIRIGGSRLNCCNKQGRAVLVFSNDFTRYHLK
jgi:hypothetical protein